MEDMTRRGLMGGSLAALAGVAMMAGTANAEENPSFDSNLVGVWVCHKEKTGDNSLTVYDGFYAFFPDGYAFYVMTEAFDGSAFDVTAQTQAVYKTSSYDGVLLLSVVSGQRGTDLSDEVRPLVGGTVYKYTIDGDDLILAEVDTAFNEVKDDDPLVFTRVQ